MVSLGARFVEFALPLLGIKRFFSQPHKMDQRIAKMRRQASPRPGRKWREKFDIAEETERSYPLVTLTPKGGARPEAPHLLYFHGGGYVMDIASLHWEAIGTLCNELGAAASVPIYPLAPEVTAETTLPAMRALYDELADRYGAQNIAIAGDSAGGGMALALVQDLIRGGKPLPGSMVLFSPWVDATASGEGMAAIAPRDKILAPVGLEACGQRYAGTLPLNDPRLSPLFGDLTGLPPTAIFVGTSDILLVDARRLKDRLEQIGEPPALYREADRMQHVWMLLPIPEGRAALRETAQFLRAQHGANKK